jgi:signal transduction histidine kinase
VTLNRISGPDLVAPPDSGIENTIELLSAVSHELRSPLTSVKGYTSLLLERWDSFADQEKQAILRQVSHDADRITRLIGELLDVSRLEAQRLTLHPEIVDLGRLAAAVVDRVRFEYPDLTGPVRFPDGFPAVYADPDRIEQVMTNLVENACKHASPVGLVVEGWAADGRAGVTVRDRGEGIPDAELPRVFERFYRRAHNGPAGSGLGLWIALALVEAHGGTLSAESKVGRGSTFTFTLPLLDLGRLQGT